MGWVRNAGAPRVEHVCQPPTVGAGLARRPDASAGCLWRCDGCSALWRVGQACIICDTALGPYPHGGQHLAGLAWRRARPWQRLRHLGRR